MFSAICGHLSSMHVAEFFVNFAMHLWSNLQGNVGDSLKKGNKCPHETCDKQAPGIHGSRDNAETRSSLPLVIFFPTQNPISLQVVRVPI